MNVRKKWMRTFSNFKIVLYGLALLSLVVTAMSWADDQGDSAPSTIRTPLPDLIQKKGPLSVNEITQKIQDAQDSATSVEMRIETNMKDTLSGQEKHFRGTVQLKSPDKVFVHYEKPDEQFLYIVGNAMRMFVPVQNTVYTQDAGKGQPFYLGVGRALKKYVKVSRVSITKDNGDEVVLLFIPNDDKQGFDRMKVSIHKKDWWPYQMEMETPSVLAKAEFKDLKFNQDMPDSLFKFTPPKDAEVVEGSAF